MSSPSTDLRFPRFHELNLRLLAYVLLVFGERRVIRQRSPEDVLQDIWVRALPRLAAGHVADPISYLTTTARHVVAHLSSDAHERRTARREHRPEILGLGPALPSSRAEAADSSFHEVEARLDRRS